jgi:acetoin utilization deacetylase AcuC-like enzyme
MTDKLKVISTTRAAGYDIPGHPEHPQRVLKSLAHLKTLLPASTFEEPTEAPIDKILSVHYNTVVEDVRTERDMDLDTPGAKGVYECSLLAAGAALHAAQEAIQGKKVFSLMRPPGHHATPDRSMGFCYFNSMAVAIQDIVHEKKAERVAVFDLDCHHGNGTQDFCRYREEFLYVSLHQFPGYPGTGRSSHDNALNYPLPPGTKAVDYFPVMESAMEQIRRFKPDLIGVSMGFDTYEKDPLTEFGLKKEDYFRIGQWLKDMKVPQFSLLEGGYDDDLPYLIEEFLKGWTT